VSRQPHYTITKLLAAVAICLFAGYIDLYLFTTAIPSWYGNLRLPDFTPPVDILFYAIIAVSILLGIALFFIIKEETIKHDIAISFYLFLFGLALNVLWFVFFFLLRSAFMGLMVMILLLTVVICTIYQTLRNTIISGMLLVPYLIILMIVAYANFQIVLMNPDLPLWGFV